MRSRLYPAFGRYFHDQQEMCKYVGCKRTRLSLILNGKAEFTEDEKFRIMVALEHKFNNNPRIFGAYDLGLIQRARELGIDEVFKNENVQ